MPIDFRKHAHNYALTFSSDLPSDAKSYTWNSSAI